MNIEKRIHRTVGQALREHRMIEEGDRLLIGASGGKDSVVVARILAEKKRYFPIKFELDACHIVTDVSDRDYQREQLLDKTFADLDIFLERRFVEVMSRLDGSRPFNCFFCAMQRRMEIIKVAKERNCNKIVYGHHMDDIIETLLMNMFYKAEISTMPARMELDNHDLMIVRPLCQTRECDIQTYSRRIGLTDMAQPCPYGTDGRRARVKKLITELAGEDERIRYNLSASIGRVKLDYLNEKLRADKKD